MTRIKQVKAIPRMASGWFKHLEALFSIYFVTWRLWSCHFRTEKSQMPSKDQPSSESWEKGVEDWSHLKGHFQKFPGAQHVESLGLSLLWCRFDAWPPEFLLSWAQPKKKKLHSQAATGCEIFPEYSLSSGDKGARSPLTAASCSNPVSPIFQRPSVWQSDGICFPGGLD